MSASASSATLLSSSIILKTLRSLKERRKAYRNKCIEAGKLPVIDALYIGGGFPETNAIALAKNAAFRKSIKRLLKTGFQYMLNAEV